MDEGWNQEQRAVYSNTWNWSAPQFIEESSFFSCADGMRHYQSVIWIWQKNLLEDLFNRHTLLNDLGVKLSQHFPKHWKICLAMYGSSQDVKSVNQLRGLLAASKTLDKLPPTEDSLYQHYLRCHYQSYIWLNSLQPVIDLPSFEDFGWQLKDSTVVPILQTLPPYPETMPFLTTCGCKKG